MYVCIYIWIRLTLSLACRCPAYDRSYVFNVSCSY